jgi:hypothetical protein
MTMTENNKPPVYPKGMFAKNPKENAPEYIITNLSFKVSEFDAFMREHSKNGWVNITIKRKKGSDDHYPQLDEYERKTSGTIERSRQEINSILKPEPKDDFEDFNDIPF